MKHLQSAYDCVVIGAGPAGSTAAALLAEAGSSVLVAERERMPRFHVGESLMPETYWTFQRLGILEQLRNSHFVRKVGVQFVSQSGKQSQPFHFMTHDPRECAQTWHVERAEFDRLLFDNAQAKGADGADQTKVVDVRFAEQGPVAVELETADRQRQTVTAQVIVDASGQQAFLANRLGLREVNPELRKVAVWGHFQGAQRTGEETSELTTILHAAEKNAWFWYIPLSRDRVSVGLVGDRDYLFPGDVRPDEVFQRHVQDSPVMKQRLSAATCVEGLFVSREFSYTTREQAGDRWVLIGDACGFIDPVYSTGVLLALRSGELAADAITAGLGDGDLSAARLGAWVPGYQQAVDRFGRLVRAFYTREFSFAQFLRQHPEYHGKLIDLLIGRAFDEGTAQLVADLDAAVDQGRS